MMELSQLLVCADLNSVFSSSFIVWEPGVNIVIVLDTMSNTSLPAPRSFFLTITYECFPRDPPSPACVVDWWHPVTLIWFWTSSTLSNWIGATRLTTSDWVAIASTAIIILTGSVPTIITEEIYNCTQYNIGRMPLVIEYVGGKLEDAHVKTHLGSVMFYSWNWTH